MPLSILHVIPSVNPAAGGTVEAVGQLSRAQAAAGTQVEIASMDRSDDPWTSEVRFPLHLLGSGGDPGGYGRSPRFTAWLRENRERYSAVISHGLWQYHSVGVWRALAGTATPYFVFPHGMLDPAIKRAYPFKHLKKSLYWMLAEHRVLRDARAVLFTCETERRLAAESFRPYRCAERVVGLGTASPEGDPKAQAARFFAEYPHLAGKRILLFLGRLHGKKACDLLISAFGRFQEETPSPGDFHLFMAGPASSEAYLCQLMDLTRRIPFPEAVSFPGLLAGDVKWGALRAADAFILPSHQENFGMAVAEALACGLPVLISDKINIWGEIKEDGAGLVAEDTLEGTLGLLRRWSELDDSGRATMQRAASACFARRFDIRRTAEEIGHLVATPGG